MAEANWYVVHTYSGENHREPPSGRSDFGGAGSDAECCGNEKRRQENR